MGPARLLPALRRPTRKLYGISQQHQADRELQPMKQLGVCVGWPHRTPATLETIGSRAQRPTSYRTQTTGYDTVGRRTCILTSGLLGKKANHGPRLLWILGQSPCWDEGTCKYGPFAWGSFFHLPGSLPHSFHCRRSQMQCWTRTDPNWRWPSRCDFMNLGAGVTRTLDGGGISIDG